MFCAGERSPGAFRPTSVSSSLHAAPAHAGRNEPRRSSVVWWVRSQTASFPVGRGATVLDLAVCSAGALPARKDPLWRPFLSVCDAKSGRSSSLVCTGAAHESKHTCMNTERQAAACSSLLA